MLVATYKQRALLFFLHSTLKGWSSVCEEKGQEIASCVGPSLAKMWIKCCKFRDMKVQILKVVIPYVVMLYFLSFFLSHFGAITWSLKKMQNIFYGTTNLYSRNSGLKCQYFLKTL